MRYLGQALAHPQRLVNVGLVRAHLGWAYFQQRDHARAAKELRQAEQFNPRHVRGQVPTGQGLLRPSRVE